MAGQLKAIANAAIGFFGLNTQESGVTLEAGYATKANNCIIDKYGRLGSRRGWSPVTTNAADLGSTNYIESIFEFVTVGGDSTIISAGGGKFFTGTTTFTRLNVYGTDASGPAILSPQPTYTTNRWQWAALQENSGASASSYAVAAQRGATALVYRRGGHSGAYVLQRIGTDYGTKPSGVTTFDPDCCHAAFGRMWYAGLTENRTTVFYSALLDPVNLTGSGSGVIDISSKVGNNDEIVAITSHNGYLIVFCKRNVVILSGAETPSSSLAVNDVVPGVGCIARDSVQQTGNDVVFLSASGVRALSRTVQEKSMPMRELSLNIRDDLIDNLQGETLTAIKSAYFERDAFYILTLPTTKQTIYFDLRNILENGAARTTIWTAQGKDASGEYYVPKAFCSTIDRNLYFGMQGKIGRYFGYDDNGSSYRMEYQTSNTDFGQAFTLKVLKKAKLIIIGNGTQNLVFKYGFDYQTNYSSVTFSNKTGSPVSEFNIAEYSASLGQTGYTGAEYSSGISINEVSLNIGGAGKVLQFGIETDIVGSPVSIQQFSVYMKTGKTV